MKLLLLAFLATFAFATQSQYAVGETIYKTTCISCHGVDGNSQNDMKLVVKPRNLSKSVLTQEQSFEIIKKGAHYWGACADIMPAFETTFSDKELHAVNYFIHKKFNPNAVSRVKELYAQSKTVPAKKLPKMLKRGKKIYKRNCSWCHGLTGKGDGEATRNPELSIFPYNLRKTLLSEKQIFLYAKYGGKYWGTHKNDMPNWSPKYDDYTLKSVARYIQKTFKEDK